MSKFEYLDSLSIEQIINCMENSSKEIKKMQCFNEILKTLKDILRTRANKK